MAVAALVRITGTVLRINRMQGSSAKTGQPYDFTQGKVLTANMDVTEVTLPKDLDRIGGSAPGEGEEVDYLAEVRINGSGRGLSINVLEDFPVGTPSLV